MPGVGTRWRGGNFARPPPAHPELVEGQAGGLGAGLCRGRAGDGRAQRRRGVRHAVPAALLVPLWRGSRRRCIVIARPKAVAIHCRWARPLWLAASPRNRSGAPRKRARGPDFPWAASGHRQLFTLSLSAAQLFRRNNNARAQPMDMACQLRPGGAGGHVILCDQIGSGIERPPHRPGFAAFCSKHGNFNARSARHANVSGPRISATPLHSQAGHFRPK